MLILTTLVALFILFPTELSDYARSMIATTLWAANIYFWQTTNYFFITETTPLLHCWSLGVEEQFYLFFPLLTMLLFRLRPALFPATIALLAAGSFALSVALTISAPMANFYLLPTRAWELLLGVLAATFPVSLLDWRPLREAVSLSGLALIVASILHYTPQTHFPGLHALPPCLGTAAVIVAGAHGRNASSMLLSTRPLVFLGLISYSLYLWHWPIIVLMLRGLPAEHLDYTAKFVAAVLMLILAVLTWQFVEKPFRVSKKPLKVVFLYSSGAMSVLILVATVLITSGGLPTRYDKRVATVASVLAYNADTPNRSHQCFLLLGDKFSDFDRKTCLSESLSEPNVLLVGDSHAAHLWFGLQSVFNRTNIMQATSTGCGPFVIKQRNTGHDECEQLMDFIYNDYLPHHHPDLILLAGRWSDFDEAGLAGLATTLDWLRQRQFASLLAGPDPNWDVALPILVALALQRADPGLVERHQLTPVDALDFAPCGAGCGA